MRYGRGRGGKVTAVGGGCPSTLGIRVFASWILLECLWISLENLVILAIENNSVPT